MKSESIQIKSLESLQVELPKIINEDFQPTIAIIFSSTKHDLKKIGSILSVFNIEVVGCTTAGEICNENILSNSISLLFLDMKKEHFRTHFVETGDRTIFQIAREVGSVAESSFKNPAVILLSGGVAIDAEQIVFGIKDVFKREIPLYGGLAGDDLNLEATYIFNNNQTTDNGLLALIIDNDKVSVEGRATSGWEPMGAVNTITKSTGNVVYSINDEPALDVFIKFFGTFDNSVFEGEQLSSISGQYPLQIMRGNGYNILRAPLIGDETERTLTLGGGVKEGDKFRFSISPGFEVIDQTISEFKELNISVPEADALVLFSCIGRHAAFGPLLEDEIKGIYNHWNTPMIGFMSYGEIGNTKSGICEFHNETCSLVILKEK